MENYVGKRLDGRYEVQEIVGVGGMSVVYRAYDNVDDRIVAVKILKDEFADDAEFVRRFKNESKAIAVLSHPNIVKVYDVSFGEKLKYIVMEYMDGITLKEYIQKQKVITWNDAVFFTTQILRALQHAHDKGIVHRDIKPQNIILLPTGNIKVTDFGIARFSRTETRTLTESAIGSVHYISPEQARGELTDERADIYSLGVVLYEMLAGKLPFEADSAVSVALKQLNEEPVRLTVLNPDVPLGLDQICIHAMQKNPLDRYQTATEMLLDLEEIIRNPRATFDYTYFVDKQPTKYVIKDESIASENDTDNEDLEEKLTAEKSQKKKAVIAVVIGIALLISAIIGIVVWMTQGVNAKAIKLDNFVGLSYDELISNNTDFEFIVEYEQSEDKDAGTIIAQKPEAGEKVIAGTKVTLVVAKSVDGIAVPNCYNVDVERAKILLDKENLKTYRIQEVSNENVESGYVIYTDPKANSIVSADQEIIIYVSTGPSTVVEEKYTVPDVVGLSQKDAKAFLSKSGFKNVTFETVDTETPKDTVVAQYPTYGTSVTGDTQIRITISTGVTTTEPIEQYNVSIKVMLPNCKEQTGNHPTDDLVIYLNDSQYTSKKVVLNGTNTDFVIPVDNGSKVTIMVELVNTGAIQNFELNINENKEKVVDFTHYSDKEEE